MTGLCDSATCGEGLALPRASGISGVHGTDVRVPWAAKLVLPFTVVYSKALHRILGNATDPGWQRLESSALPNKQRFQAQARELGLG